MRNRDLGALTAALTVLVAADALLMPLMFSWSSLFHASYLRYVMPFNGIVSAAILIFKLLTAILFCRWLYVAGDNLILADVEHLRFTPAKRVVSLFVPIASLFMPFLGMRELWNASHGERNRGANHVLVTSWWVLWIIGGVLTASLFPLMNWAAFLALALLMLQWVAQGVIVILMIHAIIRAQMKLNDEDVGDVFA